MLNITDFSPWKLRSEWIGVMMADSIKLGDTMAVSQVIPYIVHYFCPELYGNRVPFGTQHVVWITSSLAEPP